MQEETTLHSQIRPKTGACSLHQKARRCLRCLRQMQSDSKYSFNTPDARFCGGKIAKKLYSPKPVLAHLQSWQSGHAGCHTEEERLFVANLT